MGIGNEEDDDTDGDESTHPPPICHQPRRRILTMRRRNKHAQRNDSGTQGVAGDSGDAEAIAEIATQISRTSGSDLRTRLLLSLRTTVPTAIPNGLQI